MMQNQILRQKMAYKHYRAETKAYKLVMAGTML